MVGYSTLTKSLTTEYHYSEGNATPETSVREERKEYVLGKTLVRTLTKVESNGDERKTVFYYPFDYDFTATSTTFPGIGRMNDNKISSPVVSTESWVYKQGMDRLTDVHLQDYAQIGNLTIRPSVSYRFKFSLPIPKPQVYDFNPSTIFRNQNIFREAIRNEMYDLNGNPVQILNDKSFRNSMITDHRFTLSPTAEFTNAKFDDVAYTSFENLPNGPLGQQQIQHGNYLLHGPSYNEGFTGEWSFMGTAYRILKLGTYQLSYWGKGQAALSFSNPSGGTFTTTTQIKSFRGWTLYRSVITVTMPTVALVINCAAYPVDEMKIYPLTASVKTMTYNDYGELVAESENDKLIYFEYDQFGRNVRTRDIDHHILKQSEYVIQLPASGFTNKALYGIYKRSSCLGNQKGSNVEVAIPAGAFTSTVSQYDADWQAESAASAYANQNGTCSIVIEVPGPGNPPTVTVQEIVGRSITLNHTQNGGCTGVKIYFKDLNTGATYPPVTGSCSGISTIQLPNTGRKYRFSLITYTTNSPEGNFFNPIEVQIP